MSVWIRATGAGAGRVSAGPGEGLAASDLERGLWARARQQAGVQGGEDGGDMATADGRDLRPEQALLPL